MHEKYEGKCLECHTLVQKEFFDKCLACHKEVKGDVERRGGFHGKIDSFRCEICHAEHKGRANDLIDFDSNRFDHRQSDFDLTGKHKEVGCVKCHRKPKYRETSRDCFSCHQKDDKHKGSLGKQCENCHTANTWTEIRFDHSKTRFPLKGKHHEVKCEACHPSADFKSTPKTCIGCHRKDDKHKGILGAQCGQCHTANDWTETLFDHDKTDFKLVGSHQRADCLKCHTTPQLKTTPKDCYGCHQKNDPHKGKLGQQCERCHSESNWKKMSFDHSATQYPLIGKHITVSCNQCHVRERWKIPSLCVSCHRKDDPHKGKLRETCENCHTEKDWKEVERFDHQKTRFPLLGKHEEVRCGKCHQTSFFIDTPSVCFDCHKKDDYHKGKFGRNCGGPCHTEEGWKRSKFDHGKETGYALKGKHAPVKCDRCHVKPLFTQKMSRMCVICHRRDDVHDGELGTRCEICHSEVDFKAIRKSKLDRISGLTGWRREMSKVLYRLTRK